MKYFLNALNFPKKICIMLFGEDEKKWHRIIVGIIFMAIGVSIAKLTATCGNNFVEFFGDMVGYAIHGSGLVPLIDLASELAEE